MITHQVRGNAGQMIVCQLGEGQSVYCEAGKFLWKTVNVGVETRLTSPETAAANQDKGRFGKALSTAVEVGKRQLAGESKRVDGGARTQFGGGGRGGVDRGNRGFPEEHPRREHRLERLNRH